MEEIAQLARGTILGSGELNELIHQIKTQLFIFKLDPLQPPVLVNGEYECINDITCRLQPYTPAFKYFIIKLRESSACFHINQ